MSRFDASLADRARYAFTCEVQTRYGDLDTIKRINNVAMARIFEEARMIFALSSGYIDDMRPARIVVAYHGIHYVVPADYPAAVTVAVAVSQIGNSSFGLVSVAYQGDRLCAGAEATLVATDGERSVPLTGPMRENLGKYRLRETAVVG